MKFLVLTNDPADMAKLHASSGFDAPIAEAGDWTHKAGISTSSTHVFIDRDGNIAFRQTGDPDMAFTFPARIDALLAERRR